MDAVERTLKDLELEITCAICKNHYTDPKILPCLHYYCKACVGTLALKAGGQGKLFSCPECRRPTVLPEGGEDELQSVFVINRLQSMYDKHKKALNKQVVCEICTNSEAYADHFCRQCDKFACKDCVLLHSVMKTNFEGHECVPVEKLDKLLIKSNELLVSKSSKPKLLCSDHGEPLKIFCFDCNKLICGDCIVRDHRAHNIEFSNVAADSKKKELKESLQPLKEIQYSLSQTSKDMEKASDTILSKQKLAIKKIGSSFEELHKILEAHQTRLIYDINKLTDEKLNEISTQAQSLSTSRVKVQDVIDYTEQSIQSFSNEEVMSNHVEITHAIQALINQHKLDTNQKPVKKMDFVVGLDCTKKLEQLLNDVFVTTLSSLEVTNLKDIPRTVNVLRLVKFELSFTPGIVIPVQSLKCQLSESWQWNRKDSTVIANITELSTNKFLITYTPKMYGRHALDISVYGHRLPGTPIYVEVNKTLLWDFRTN